MRDLSPKLSRRSCAPLPGEGKLPLFFFHTHNWRGFQGWASRTRDRLFRGFCPGLHAISLEGSVGIGPKEIFSSSPHGGRRGKCRLLVIPTLERCRSGRTGLPAKQLYGLKPVPRVRIPPSPPVPSRLPQVNSLASLTSRWPHQL